MTDNKKKLRIITYLSPGVPVELFELIRDYLEEELDTEAYIIYESRWSGPPPERVDPFTADDADIGVMCSTAYLRLVQDKNEFIELCTAAPLHQHPLSAGKPVYFSDLIIHTDDVKKYKDFLSLRGCRWAYNDEISLSGNLAVLAELKKQGFNASFFGNILKSGSHLNSIEMVLNHTADVAAIDSNTLASYRRQFPERSTGITVLTSLGPNPIYPVVFNKRLTEKVKDQITELLLLISSNPKWAEKFQKLGVVGYSRIDSSFYNMEQEVKDLVKGISLNVAYY